MAWYARTPSNNNPSIDLLKGIALIEEGKVSSSTTAAGSTDKKSNTSKHFRYFPKENLSYDVKGRFRELFEMKPSYSIETIAPYLDDLYGQPGQPQSLAALLLNHCKNIDNLYQLK